MDAHALRHAVTGFFETLGEQLQMFFDESEELGIREP